MITKRPLWRRIRHMLRLIEHDGISPTRAASLAAVPEPTLEQARPLVTAAESRYQLTAVRSLQDAGKDTLRYEYGWAPTQSNAEAATLAGSDGRAPVRMRATPVRGDWKATAFLLERRFPQEYGSQQPAQVAETVVNVLTALAALRSQPASLESLRHRPQLPSGQDARAREGTATPETPGTP